MTAGLRLWYTEGADSLRSVDNSKGQAMLKSIVKTVVLTLTAVFTIAFALAALDVMADHGREVKRVAAQSPGERAMEQAVSEIEKTMQPTRNAEAEWVAKQLREANRNLQSPQAQYLLRGPQQ